MFAQITGDYAKRRPHKAVIRVLSASLFEGRAFMQPGRWLNPLVFAHFAVEKMLPQMKKVEKPIYITGTGRSGTTILGTTLGFHRECAYLNEPRAMWHACCPNEDVIGSYDRSKNARFILEAEHAADDVSRYAHRLYGAYLRFTCSKRVVDKSEWNHRLNFLKAIFPDAKILFLVRNGWDTCASINKWSNIHREDNERETYDWWGVDGRKWHFLVDQVVANEPEFADIMDVVRELTSHTDRAVVEWIVTMNKGLDMMDRMPESIFLVKFEDLCAKPVETLKSVTDFCELTEDQKLFDYAKSALRPVKPYDHFEVAPALLPLFEKTLDKLGYS